MEAGRILVCRGGALGDLMLTLPVFHAVRRRWPTARITFAGYLPHARLVMAAGLADEFLSLDSADTAEWFGSLRDVPASTLERLGAYDAVVTLLLDDDARFQSLLRLAGVREIYYRSPIVCEGHASEHLLGVLGTGESTLCLVAMSRGGELVLPAHALEAGRLLAERLGNRVLALHPGSGSPRKNWTLDAFVSVARTVRDSGLAVPVFILGEAESGMAEGLRWKCPEVAVVRALDVVTLGGLLAHCAAYVGNDSGVTHLAAAVGASVVALFGSTDPARWAPRGPKVRVLGGSPDRDGVPLMKVSEVVEAVATGLAEG